MQTAKEKDHLNSEAPLVRAQPVKRPIPLCYNLGYSRTIYGI